MILLIIGAIFFAWSQRLIIADKALRDQLAQYDVAADYEIVEIGPRFQKLRNVVIGDPENPDFTAKEVDVDVEISFTGAVLRTIWVRGASLKGRIADGAISFGALDKLLASDSDEPFEFPDLALDIANSNASIDTQWGRIGIGVNGRGHLQSSFIGALAVQSNQLEYDQCIIGQTQFAGQIKISNQQPRLSGDLTNESIRCAGIGAAQNIAINGSLNLSQDFSRWRGNADIMVAGANNPDVRLANVDANLDFSGNVDRTDVKYDLRKGSLFTDQISFAAISTNGEGRLSLFNGEYNIAARGYADIGGGALNPSTTASLRSYENIADNSPPAPLIRIWAPAVARSAENFSGNLGYDIALGKTVNGRNNIILDNVRFASRSGAGLSLSNDVRLSKNSGGGSWRIASPIGFALRGGKLPDISANIAQGAGDRWSGSIEMPAYKAGDALLALRDFKFSGSPSSSWTFSGNSRLSGAIPSGRIDGLVIDIDGNWSKGRGLTLLKGCKNIAFDSLQAADLRLGKQTLRLCPENGASIVDSMGGNLRVAVRSNALNLDGLLGQTAINMQSSGLSFSLANGLDASDVRIAIGQSEAVTLFNMDRLTADFSGPMIMGRASGGSAKIAAVPLDMDSGALEWTLSDNILGVTGQLMVRDAQQVARFEPVLIPDLLLSLENGEISALAQIQEPKTLKRLADVDLLHNLSNAAGRALFSVDNLRFNDELQPDQLTNIVLGVVANVQGTINGDGAVIWDGDNLTSRGTFTTENMDLAAAFGPVKGLTGKIILTDLLNFESAERQIITLASVNPGVEVLDGRISYQLLPGQKVEIYGGSWPFSGGRLILEPTVWDLGEEAQRKMAFEVTGMDAGIFLQQFDFSNVTASGTFDGRLPMVFDKNGGRIVGGSLVSTTGGNVAYVGDLTYEDLSVFGNFAFNALKSIDYQSLTIDMDGDIDGEIVTGVRIRGLQQGAGANRNFITKQLAKIPIIFNVNIKASFLELLSLAEGYNDPSLLANRYVSGLQGNLNKEDNVNKNSDQNEQTVQPVESKDSP